MEEQDWKSRLAADRAAYRPPTLHAKVNQFAIRCFRDTGDGDYIAARLSMRACLYTQYLWAAEQAVEKYLKCILMLNRHNTKNLGHKVERVLGAVRACLRVELKLTEVEQQAFDNLVRWDADRYLIRSYHVEQVELAGLDLLVWRLRQYCEPLDVNHYADDPSQDLLKVNLAEIEGRALHPSKAGHVSGGELEKILEEKRHPARTGLIWHNLRYNNANRRSTRMSPGWRLVNSPLDMAYDQAVINDAERWMRLA